LLILQADSAYTCGAHPEYDRAVGVFDLASGRALADAFAEWPKQLPPAVRRPAAEKIHPEFVECQADEGAGSPLMDELARDGMFLNEVSVALAAGVPEIRWVFGLSVTYACSSDYMLPGASTSGLLPEAAPLGLVPVPAGVSKAFAAIGSASAVGWSHLALEPAARAAVLAAFTASPEPSWPAERVGYKEEEPPPTASPAKERLDAARRLTREKDYPAAILAFNVVIALDPALAAAWSGRGYARLLSGDLAQAKRDLETALTHDATPAFQAAVHFNLGQVAEKAGDVPAARAAYARSLASRETRAVKAALAALDSR
jgi:tetratricopeptide (TPR) repeat protein